MYLEIGARGGSVKQLRTETRMKVSLAGELSGPRGLVACRVVDISRGGACVDADRGHAVGEIVSLSRGTLRATGEIMWSRGKRLGVRFDQPIRATELLVQMSHSRSAAQAAQRSPRLSAALPISA